MMSAWRQSMAPFQPGHIEEISDGPFQPNRPVMPLMAPSTSAARPVVTAPTAVASAAAAAANYVPAEVFAAVVNAMQHLPGPDGSAGVPTAAATMRDARERRQRDNSADEF